MQHFTPPLTKMSTSHIVSTHRLIAFTTPETYAVRLSPLIHLKGWTPLSCPTVSVQPTPHTNSSLLHHISHIQQFSALAFTSRTGISAFSDALSELQSPPLPPSGDEFTISALGKDAELIDNSFVSRLCVNSDRIRVLIPEVPSPAGMVEALGFGGGRRVLCPVPLVVGLEEPSVVPDFLRGLGLKGWVAVRVEAYETRWMGAECAVALLRGGVNAVVFTSTSEVEGVLKSLRAIGVGWGEVVRRNPGMVVAAHGPVTAAGAEGLGVRVDVVSGKFGSFDGVLDAIAKFWND